MALPWLSSTSRQRRSGPCGRSALQWASPSAASASANVGQGRVGSPWALAQSGANRPSSSMPAQSSSTSRSKGERPNTSQSRCSAAGCTPIIFGRATAGAASVRRFVAGGAGGPTALHMPLQRETDTLQRRHEIALVGAMPCLLCRLVRSVCSVCLVAAPIGIHLLYRDIIGCDCAAPRRRHRARRASGRTPDRSPRADIGPGARTRVWSGLPYLRIQEQG